MVGWAKGVERGEERRLGGIILLLIHMAFLGKSLFFDRG